MPKKINIKKILIIAFVLLVLVLAVRAIIQNAIDRANMENRVYTSMSDFTSIKDIAEYMGCKYIKVEEATSDYFDIDIYLVFKYQLYTDDISNEDYYYRMIALMLEFVNYKNIRLIDNEKNIVIAVQADQNTQEITNLLINGEVDYFGTQETLKSIKNYQIFDVAEIKIQAKELEELIDNKWVTKQVNFGTKDSTFNNYDIYFDEGIEVKTVNKKVFNIIFTEKYEKEVVNGIKVNTSFDEIKNILGTPSFSHENYVEDRQKDIGYIGYKGKNIYIFFSENEISIYRVAEPNTSTGLADAIKIFNNDAELRRFISSITDMWPDYDMYIYDEDNVTLKYSLRGIKIAFTPSEAGVYVYSNYNGYIADDVTIEDITKNAELIPRNVNMKIDKDLVDIYEESRIMIYNDTYGNAKMGMPDYYTSEFNVDVAQDVITFISKKRNYPNHTINKKVNTFIIVSDTEFVFDDEEGIVYKYNAATQELSDLSKDTNILTINKNKFMYVKGRGLYLYNIETKKLQQVLTFEKELTGIYNYDNIFLIIGIKNTGIYKYNTQTNQLEALTEGQGEYIINTIFENKVFYDDTLVIIK